MLVEHGVLGRVHAAYLGTVRHPQFRVAGASALDEDHLLGLLAVGGTQDLAGSGPRGAQQPFKGQAINHVRDLAVAVFTQLFHRVEVVACGHDDTPHPFLDDGLFLLKVNSPYRTKLFTDAALTALKVDAVIAVEDRLVRHSLGREGVDGLPPARFALKFRDHALGAFLLAEAAAGAHVPIHISRIAADAHPEIAYLARNILYLRIGHQLDVLVVSHLHRARGQDTLGTVQSGEGL